MNTTSVTRQKVDCMKYHNHDGSRHAINKFEKVMVNYDDLVYYKFEIDDESI
jgi:hypothetical protein